MVFKAYKHNEIIAKAEKKFKKLEIFNYSNLRKNIEKQLKKDKMLREIPDLSPKSISYLADYCICEKYDV